MPPSYFTSSPITRRRLAALTAAGGSAFLLSACGSDADPNADKSDVELLGLIRELQAALADGYDQRPADAPPGQVSKAFAPQTKALLGELDKAISDLGASQPPDATFSANLDVGSVADYEPLLIGVTNAVVPDLGTDALRQLAYRVTAAAAGRIAATAQIAGEDPAPEAFVLGELPPGFEGVSS